MRAAFLFLIAVLIPFFAGAQVEISEIMYDLEGADSGREWVEIFNNSESEVDLKDWKFNDGSNHILNDPPKNSGKGSLIIPARGYAIFADNAETFFSEHISYNGILIDTVMSLNNTAATLKLFNKEGTEINSVNYNNASGASGDGNSLQKTGGSWVSASPTYGVQNTGQESQSQNNQSGDSNSSNGSEQTSENIPSQNPNSDKILFKENRIKAYAGEGRIGVVGADIEFKGEALGIKNYPLDYAKTKFAWNFGDGAYYEGRVVKHSYFFPGKYIAVLDISSGEHSASDRIIVNVLPNEVIIFEISQSDSRVKIYNGSRETLDISFWQISYKNKNFIFPKNTFIRGKEYLTIPKEISGFDFSGIAQDKVKLLYPNGVEAASFYYSEKKNDLDKEDANSNKKITAVKNNNSRKKIKNNTAFVRKSANNYNLAAVVTADSEFGPNYEATSSKTEQVEMLPDEIVLNSNSEGETFRNKASKWKWFFAAFGVSLISGAAFFVFRKTKD